MLPDKDIASLVFEKKEWLNSREAAGFLGISVGSLRNMICNGTIQVSGKIGRLNRFKASDLEELLRRGKTERRSSYGDY